MKKTFLLLIILSLTILNLYGVEIKSLKYQYHITTDFPEKIMESLRKKADQVGGFVSYFNGKMLRMRVPAKNITTIIDLIKNSTFIQDTQLHSKNHSEDLISLKARLKAKNELLKQLYAIFKTVTMVQTLEVEQELNRYIGEIEDLKGKIRFIENQYAFAEFTIYINYENYTPPASKVHVSHWSWINQLGLPQLLRN